MTGDCCPLHVHPQPPPTFPPLPFTAALHLGRQGKAYTRPVRPAITRLPLLPSGVGSVAERQPEAAVRQVLRRYPHLPYWPQLPRRAVAELMLPQFGLCLPGASWDGERLHWPGEAREADIAAAALPPPQRAAGWQAFLAQMEALEPAARPAIAKGQLPGPLTLSLALRDRQGRTPHAEVRSLIWTGWFLGRLAVLQAQELQRLGMRPLIVFDEPALAAVGGPLLPLPWADVVAAIRAALAPLQQCGAIAALHCCQPADWTRVLEAQPDLIHFEALPERIDDLLAHGAALREHLRRGGLLGWGVWPTGGGRPFDVGAAAESLAQAAAALAPGNGGPAPVLEHSMVTGVCGAAGLTTAQEERMAADLASLAAGLRTRWGIRAPGEGAAATL